MPQLEDLEVLVAVASAGSLTAAAKQLGRAQSTVSRRVAGLEHALGVSLLDRTGGPATLTPAGRAVVDFGVVTLERYAALVHEVRTLETVLSGTVRVIASTAPATLLPRVLAGFGRRHPDVRFEVVLADSAVVATTVAEGRADLGFSGHEDDDPRLVHQPIASDEIVLAVPVGHRFARRRRVALEELRGERFVLREDGSGTQRVFQEALTAAGHAPVVARSTVTVGSATAVVEAVSAGLGVGIVSESALPASGGDVVAVRLAELPLTRPLWLVRRVDDAMPVHREAFVSYVSQVLSRSDV